MPEAMSLAVGDCPKSKPLALPAGVLDNETLRQEVIARPDDDAPREAYAGWLLRQDHEFARTIGAFVAAQLRVARAFRADRLAKVAELRSWSGAPAYTSTAQFRAGDSLRPWFLDRLHAWLSSGLVGWPQVYRGFVERVAMHAGHFLEAAPALFRVAPIRHLILIGVPQVAKQLARCPHLSRIHSLSLPQYSPDDALSDETLSALLESPYLGNIAHLRLVHQQRLKPRSYERLATAPTLPRLSYLETFAKVSWVEPVRELYDPIGRTERMIARDTTQRVTRPKSWITNLESKLGYIPCLHPEEHYGFGYVDLEAVTEHPIALDPTVMSRRGQRAPRAPSQGRPS